jgi:hypothetical protein
MRAKLPPVHPCSLSVTSAVSPIVRDLQCSDVSGSLTRNATTRIFAAAVVQLAQIRQDLKL